MPALHGGGKSRPEQESGSFPAAGGRADELHPVSRRKDELLVCYYYAYYAYYFIK
jgi:hypothetical protein